MRIHDAYTRVCHRSKLYSNPNKNNNSRPNVYARLAKYIVAKTANDSSDGSGFLRNFDEPLYYIYTEKNFFGNRFQGRF